jgi:hypothetical protein
LRICDNLIRMPGSADPNLYFTDLDPTPDPGPDHGISSVIFKKTTKIIFLLLSYKKLTKVGSKVFLNYFCFLLDCKAFTQQWRLGRHERNKIRTTASRFCSYSWKARRTLPVTTLFVQWQQMTAHSNNYTSTWGLQDYRTRLHCYDWIRNHELFTNLRCGDISAEFDRALGRRSWGKRVG